MKKILLTTIMGTSLIMAGTVFAERVHDWQDLRKVHDHINEAIHEMEDARRANHYDMNGHGAKAEEFLRKAEREINIAIGAVRR